VTTILPFFFLA